MNVNLIRIASFLLALACVQCLPAFADQPASRARVVCFGDSITKRGYSEILARLIGVDVINAGVGGNSTARALRRMSARNQRRRRQRRGRKN